MRVLRVTGPSFCAAAVFEKKGDEWAIVMCAPYLRKIIGKTPVSGLKQLLTSKGLEYEWIKESQDAQTNLPAVDNKRS